LSKMAQGKKSFVLYADQRAVFDKMDDEQAGKLIKHIFSFVNDEDPEGDFITELGFAAIKTQLKRDLEKWRETKEKRVQAGAKGGKQKVANATKSKQKQANVAVNGNVNVNVNENVMNNNPPNPPEGEEIEVILPFQTDVFKSQWQLWKQYRKQQHRFTYKSPASEQAALTELGKMSSNQERAAISILHHTMAHGWRGFVAPKEEESSSNMINVADI